MFFHRQLGPAPCWKGLFRWVLCWPIAIGAWHLYLNYPVGGLLAVGLTPFVCLFLFFRGARQIGRTLPYAKTILRAKRLGMNPSWGCSRGGFLLVDPQAGLWASDRAGGSLGDIIRLLRHEDIDSYRLEIFTKKMDDEPTESAEEEPFAVIGMGGTAHLNETAEHLRQDILAFCNREVPICTKMDT